MSAERGWIIPPDPKPGPYSVEVWAEQHRGEGHNPQPAATEDNPERWVCDCGTIWRILTLEQTRRKYAHLRRQNP